MSEHSPNVSVYSFLEVLMFIRKALIVYLLLESRAEPDDKSVVFDDWIVDWRWLGE